LHITVTYLTATINTKTRKAEPETGTDGSRQTRQNPRVDGYGYRLGLPRSSGLGFWIGLELNWTVFPVQTRTAGGSPGPVANTRGRRRLYEERLFDVAGFPFLLSVLVLLYSKASTTLTQNWLLSGLEPFNMNYEASFPNYNSISCYQYHLRLTPSVTASLSAHHVALNSLHSPNYMIINEESPSSHPASLLSYRLPVFLQLRSIKDSNSVPKLRLSQPPSICLNTHHYGLQVHLQTRSITVSKCISNFAPLRPPSSPDHRLQVHLQSQSITASKYIFNQQRQVYRDTGAMELDRVMGSIYLADPGVYRHHPISISSYHTTKIHTLSFPSFGLTHSVRDFMDPHICVDPQCLVESYLLFPFVLSSNQRRSFLSILFGCPEMCGGVLTMGSLPPRSILSLQQHPEWWVSN